MPSAYPGGLDSLATNHVTGDTIAAATTNDIADAVNKIEAELGLAPSGSEATLVARLAAIDAAIAGGVADGSVTLAKLASALKPSSSAAGADEAVRRLGTGATHAAAGDDSRFPSTGQGNALPGTVGTPGDTNRYVTNSDPRNSDARTPTAHGHAQADVTGLGTALNAKQPLDSDLTAIAALITTAFGRGLLESADSAAARATLGASASTLTQNTQTASYTAVVADQGKVIEMNVASANTFTVPPNSSVAFPLGTVIEVYQMGAGQTTLTPGTGVTLRERESKLKTAGPYATVRLRQRAINEWVIAGDVAA